MNLKSTAVRAFALAASFAFANGALAAEAQEVERSKVCMMQDRVQPGPGIAHSYQGKTYYLCCPMCASTFESDPERYSKATDPVSGKQVDKATAPLLGYGGKVYFFESETTKTTFRGESERYARSLQDHQAERR